MGARAPSPAAIVNRPVSILGAAAAAGLVAASAFHAIGANRRVEATRRFFSRFGIDVRRPLEVEAVSLAPAADWSAGIAADAVLTDATAPVSLASIAPEDRPRWIEMAENLGDEMEGAEALLLDAIPARPGWGYYPYLLGELAFAAENRAGESSRSWEAPFAFACRTIPGDDDVWSTSAGAVLETDPEALGGPSEALLRRALYSSDFVRRGAAPISDALGSRRLVAMLPDEPEPLRAALDVFAARGDLGAVAALARRYDGAERRSRADDLREVERRRRLRDFVGLAEKCEEWVRRHPVREIDDRVGRAQAARILDLWPADAPGNWRDDPRADLVRYFLDGRMAEAPGTALERAADILVDVPDPVAARAMLAAGDVREADERAARSASAGGFEWTPFFVDRARAALGDRDLPAARRALESIAPAARDECDVLAVRRDVARAAGDAAEEAAAQQRLDGEPLALASADWKPQSTLSVCLASRAPLRIEIRAQRAAVVAWGWDGGTAGSVSVDGAFEVPVSSMPPSGRHVVGAKAWTGGGVRIIANATPSLAAVPTTPAPGVETRGPGAPTPGGGKR